MTVLRDASMSGDSSRWAEGRWPDGDDAACQEPCRPHKWRAGRMDVEHAFLVAWQVEKQYIKHRISSRSYVKYSNLHS